MFGCLLIFMLFVYLFFPSLFVVVKGPPRTKQKRKVQAKDVIFVMEQERETRRSLLLYKSLLN